jgi:hypothetical protein
MAFAFSRMAATLIFATGRGAASFLSILSVRRKLKDCNASNKNKQSITFLSYPDLCKQMKVVASRQSLKAKDGQLPLF